MENLRRLGGVAGVAAGVAAAWLFFGLVFVFPSTGLSMADQQNAHKSLAFIGKHQDLTWIVNIPGGFLPPLLILVVLVALGERFRDEAPASSRVGPLLGIVGVIGIAAAALVRHVGFAGLSILYRVNKAGAVYAFYALFGMVKSFLALGDIALGLAALVLGIAMVRTRTYTTAGYVGVVAGLMMILAGFTGRTNVLILSFVPIAVWQIWTGLALLGEVGRRSEAAHRRSPAEPHLTT